MLLKMTTILKELRIAELLGMSGYHFYLTSRYLDTMDTWISWILEYLDTMDTPFFGYIDTWILGYYGYQIFTLSR